MWLYCGCGLAREASLISFIYSICVSVQYLSCSRVHWLCLYSLWWLANWTVPAALFELKMADQAWLFIPIKLGHGARMWNVKMLGVSPLRVFDKIHSPWLLSCIFVGFFSDDTPGVMKQVLVSQGFGFFFSFLIWSVTGQKSKMSNTYEHQEFQIVIFIKRAKRKILTFIDLRKKADLPLLLHKWLSRQRIKFSLHQVFWCLLFAKWDSNSRCTRR